MNEQKTVLPPDFDGTFRFTNRDTEPFTDYWNGKAYTFPTESTSPMLIMDATPIEVQHIRKKFAKNWAIKMFFNSDKAKQLTAIERNPDGTPRLNSIMGGNSYSESDLATFIQMCLEPLPISKAVVTEAPKLDVLGQLKRDDDGDLITQVSGQGGKLKLKEFSETKE